MTTNTDNNTAGTSLKPKCQKRHDTSIMIAILLFILLASSTITVVYATPSKPERVMSPTVTEITSDHDIYVFQICSMTDVIKDDLVLVTSDSSVIALKINKQIDKKGCGNFSVNLITNDPNTTKTEFIAKENIEKRKTIMEKKILTLESIVQRLIDEHQSHDDGNDDLHATDNIPSRANALLEYKKKIIAKVNAIDLFIKD